MSTFGAGLRTGIGTTGTGATFGVKPVAASGPVTPPQKLTYEQLDANTKKLVEAVQYPASHCLHCPILHPFDCDFFAVSLSASIEDPLFP